METMEATLGQGMFMFSCEGLRNHEIWTYVETAAKFKNVEMDIVTKTKVIRILDARSFRINGRSILYMEHEVITHYTFGFLNT